MNEHDENEARELWDRLAGDWHTHIGAQGDRNRLLNSDPILWQMVGEVAGMSVLDAGCGTGYLSRELYARGANVIGVDLSPKMCKIAATNNPRIEFRTDSCTALTTIADGSIDIVVANYVLMDLSDLQSAMDAFARVLVNGGFAVLVFSHPCFPQGRGRSGDDGTREYSWEFPYFEPRKCVDSPWGHFTENFTWFHRPLSGYWKAFKQARFEVEDFEEPRLTEDRAHLARSKKELMTFKDRPYSVAFKLRKAKQGA